MKRHFQFVDRKAETHISVCYETFIKQRQFSVVSYDLYLTKVQKCGQYDEMHSIANFDKDHLETHTMPLIHCFLGLQLRKNSLQLSPFVVL